MNSAPMSDNSSELLSLPLSESEQSIADILLFLKDPDLSAVPKPAATKSKPVASKAKAKDIPFISTEPQSDLHRPVKKVKVSPKTVKEPPSKPRIPVSASNSLLQNQNAQVARNVANLLSSSYTSLSMRKKAASGSACEQHKRWKKKCPDDCPMRRNAMLAQDDYYSKWSDQERLRLYQIMNDEFILNDVSFVNSFLYDVKKKYLWTLTTPQHKPKSIDECIRRIMWCIIALVNDQDDSIRKLVDNQAYYQNLQTQQSYMLMQPCLRTGCPCVTKSFLQPDFVRSLQGCSFFQALDTQINLKLIESAYRFHHNWCSIPDKYNKKRAHIKRPVVRPVVRT